VADTNRTIDLDPCQEGGRFCAIVSIPRVPSDASSSDGQGLSAAKAVMVGHLLGHGARACHHRHSRIRRLRLVCAAWTADRRSGRLRRGLDMVVVDSAEVEAVGAKSRCLARPRAAACCGDGPYMAKRMDLRAH